MATKKKSGKKTTKKSKKSKKKNNGFAKIIAVILVLALISMLITFGITSWNGKQQPIAKHKAEITAVTDQVQKIEKPAQKVERRQPAKAEATATEKQPEIKELPEPKKSAIEGTWLSSLNGTMLTINGSNYIIDFMSVDAPEPMSGKFSINGETISFFDETSRCQDIRGDYRFAYVNDSTLVIELIQDGCPKREASLDSDWKRI